MYEDEDTGTVYSEAADNARLARLVQTGWIDTSAEIERMSGY
ncbi:hypothetical protein ACFVAV_23355 [Nocardia sp. NPDC057663]